MQELNNMIKDILRANEENKLALFIGAGVSANSGFKSWWQIVDKFNENKKYISNSDRDYSDDEILKIPQFVFRENKDLYYNILEDEYNKLPTETNPIIDMLLHLQPNHIITTNYDRLIEQSIEGQHIYGNTMFEDFSKYSKIINDTGFISAKKPHYFIKMHGDLEDRESIVLKEEDYLEFSNKHSLIETFIKSLFVNHTIVFVGYGLNDNNLKLIMSWVNNFTKKSKDKKNINKYYYINAENTELSRFEKDYYLDKNIVVIESSKIPDIDVYMENEVVIDDYRGQNLYRTAKYLNYGIENSLEDFIRNLEDFENMNRITPNELCYALDLSASWMKIIDGVMYDGVEHNPIHVELIKRIQENPSSNKSQVIKTNLLKAGIKGIVVGENEAPEIPHSNKVGLLEIFWMQQEPDYDVLWLGDTDNHFYDAAISHDFVSMIEMLSIENKETNHLLKQAYLYTFFWEDSKAVSIYRDLDEQF